MAAIYDDRTIDRFWSKVEKSEDPDGCWLWTGKTDKPLKQGYGRFYVQGKWIRSHRFSYTAICGEIPENMVIAHRCDCPRCVRPNHLFLATQAENVADMMAKGRNNQSKGERVNTAKLTAEQVIEIRKLHRLGESASSLAQRYGVGSTNIDEIVHRRSWKHIA